MDEREHRTIAVDALYHVIEGLQETMRDIGVQAMKIQRARDGFSADLERHQTMYETLWHMAAGQLSITQGRLLALEQELRALAEGKTLHEVTFREPYDIDAAVVEYMRTQALDDLEPGPPGAL